MPHPLNFKNSVCIKLKPPASGRGFIILFYWSFASVSALPLPAVFSTSILSDAGAVHINNLEAVAIPQEVVAGSRDMPDIGNDETGHSIETSFFFQRQLIQIKEVFKFADRQ